MKLVQFFLPGKGKRVGLIREDRVLDLTLPEDGIRSTLDLIVQGKTAEGLVTRVTWLAKSLRRKALEYADLHRPPTRRAAHLLLPIDPPEVWVADVASPADPVPQGGEAQPAFLFKATAARCVGPHAPIAIRSDSRLTVPEAELAILLGASGSAVAFTVCNDVTARDIVRQGPRHLSRAKTYLGCCALGPCLVTPDELGDPHALQVRCSILRQRQTVFSETANTARLRFRAEELTGWLQQENPIPAGSVLAAGVGIAVPDAAALQAGDRVEIEVQGIGRLSNPVGRPDVESALPHPGGSWAAFRPPAGLLRGLAP